MRFVVPPAVTIAVTIALAGCGESAPCPAGTHLGGEQCTDDAVDGGMDAADAALALDAGTDATDAAHAVDGGMDAADAALALDSGTDATVAFDASDAATPVNCGVAPTVGHAGAATVSDGAGGGTTTTLGATAAYVCDSGYTKSGSNATCGSSGTWSAEPTCAPVNCSATPTVSSAGAAAVSGGAGGGTTVTYGATAAYTCNTGYTKSGSDPICGSAGTWGTPPTCALVNCGAAPSVGHADAATVSGGTGGGTTYGASAAYTCSTGYTKSGSDPICGSSGSWSAVPTCVPMNCGAAPLVANAGAASVSGGAGGGATTSYGATAAYTCTSGYTKMAADPTCSSDGTWSTAPTCAPPATGCGGGACMVTFAGVNPFTTRQAQLATSVLTLVADTQGYSSSGTFTVPAGITSVTAYALGGGGAGVNDFNAPGGGGGAAQRTFTVTPGAAIPFIVGAGGTNQGDGTDSSLAIGGVTITGGAGKSAGTGGLATGGTVNVTGGAGGSAGVNTTGVCSAAGGAQAINDGVDHYRIAPYGGCYPAGEGGYGPPQWGHIDVGAGYYWGSMGAWVHQPGGPGGSYGGGGGSGGNYYGAGGEGGGGYVLFSWASTSPVFSTSVTGVAVTSGAQLNTTGWTGLTSVTPTENTTNGAVYYALSFDNRQSFAIKVGGTARTIVRSTITNTQVPDDPRLWQYNSNTAYGSQTWTNCTANSSEACLSQAFGVAQNRMTGTQVSAVSDWSGTFAAGTLDFAIGMSTSNASTTPTVSRIDLTH